ncbi:MAG: hypothetical protein EOM70_00280 [Clostridia bacterium]|nr:hypothetical protein [Clostridia bacterium]
MIKRLAPALLLLATLLFMSQATGCVRVAPAQVIPPETDPAVPVASESLPSAKGPSGTLRLWWDYALPENPLQTASPSGKAAYSLVFGQLFRMDAAWQLQPELVQAFSYNEERLQLTLSLRQDVQFHDSSPVTSNDILATLSEIQRLGPLSPYAQVLSAYSSGRLIDAKTLVLQLTRPDPAFLHALTFPVVKASEVALPAGSLWQGTRTFQMLDLAQEGLYLARVETSPATTDRLEKILIKTYPSAIQAMRGLEDDELDLAFLPTESLHQYQMRSSLRLDRFASRSYFYFTFGKSVTDPIEQLRFKYFFRAARWSGSGLALPGQASDVPIPAFHACFSDQPLDLTGEWANLLVQNGLATQDTSPSVLATLPDPATLLNVHNESLRILVPDNQAILLDLAQQAASWLEQAGQPALVVALSDADFAAELELGTFDLAFQSHEIPVSAEPSWFFALDEPLSQTVAEGLPEDSANRYDDSLSPLETGWPFFKYLSHGLTQDEKGVEALSNLYRQVLVEQIFSASSGGILQGETAIAYGDRVIGRCQPTNDKPYFGIEDLWIWSGS